MEKLTPEERLLNAIFADDDDDEDNYPDTNAEKISYVMYALTKSLEYTSAALIRLQRLDRLLAQSGMPDVIINNEARLAGNHLRNVKLNVDDAYNEVAEVYKRTKGDSK